MTNIYTIPLQVRWSDLDPNFHVRHSVYYDWGAACRMEFLGERELTALKMKQLAIGPILFREECQFKKEVRMGEQISMSLYVYTARKDYSRWSIRHEILRKGEEVCAIVQVDGAWMDAKTRKLTIPPAEVCGVFDAMPRYGDFKWLDA